MTTTTAMTLHEIQTAIATGRVVAATRGDTVKLMMMSRGTEPYTELSSFSDATVFCALMCCDSVVDFNQTMDARRRTIAAAAGAFPIN